MSTTKPSMTNKQQQQQLRQKQQPTLEVDLLEGQQVEEIIEDFLALSVFGVHLLQGLHDVTSGFARMRTIRLVRRQLVERTLPRATDARVRARHASGRECFCFIVIFSMPLPSASLVL